MLAHEIKNPLSGIRGAAQLLEASASDEDRALTRLICDETDRIVKLVDRMQSFADSTPSQWESLNIHAVLDHVKRLAQAGFARHVRFTEVYDPSLPHVLGSRDQLIQVFLNLVKNAAEAIGDDSIDGEITLTTAYRPGVRLRTAPSAERVSLPLEICVRDNGSGHRARDCRKPVRPVRHDQGQGLWSGSCTGRKAGRRPRRHDRMRIASAQDGVSRPDAAAVAARLRAEVSGLGRVGRRSMVDAFRANSGCRRRCRDSHGSESGADPRRI